MLTYLIYLKRHCKFVSKAYLSNLSLDEDQMPHDLQPERPVWATQQASIPTWGRIKTLCHQAQEIVSPQGSLSSPERACIAILALLFCQNSLAEYSEALN